MSKDLKPKQRLGQTADANRKRWIVRGIVLLACAGGGYAAYNYATASAPVEVPVTKVRKGEFVISVRTRGEIRSTRSEIITAPQVPDPRITKLAEAGKPVKKGDIIVEFDAAQQEQTYLEKNTSVRTADSQIVQTKASHRITNEMDGMNLMTAQFNLERAKLDASKAEVVSEIEGAKSRIDVGISEGELSQVKTTVKSHKTSQEADLERLEQQKDKVVRDMERSKGYLSKMVLRAPNDGIVNVLPNFRTQGSWGQSPPPFKEGDRAWTGAAIAEIPDLSEMRIDLKLEEVERGKLRLGMPIRIRVDAIPDQELEATLDWISPIAAVVWRGMGMTDKTFPARGTLKKVDPRLRPGMSATAEILIESESASLLIPARASFMNKGKPSVWVQRGSEFVARPIEVGKRNDSDLVVKSGLKEGDVIALENPAEALKRAKKL
ncbi:MAG: efflux RND transporter periplasmic adaptor subunit [Bryobacteraceae bacterium]|nr:efflux RND transporter periplasmic adaptor subunit [Bryobacteraceae bacterium]